MSFVSKIFGSYSDREVKRIKPIVQKILALEDKYAQFSESELKNQTQILKERLAQGETLDDVLPEAFATVREASWRVLMMKHYPVQLIGGIVLHQGRIAEMKTGEGKTLVATLPVYLNALTGQGVHVITVNDYLAKRDAEWMGKVYNYLGLSVGLIVHGIKNEQRRESYASDIVYGTNNEFGFDYLRDNMVNYLAERVQRKLQFAIVDEVDSILIDEARTPLIISGKGDAATDMYENANRFVLTLKKFIVTEVDEKIEKDEIAGDADYIIDEKAKSAVLTKNGVARAEKYFGIDNLSDQENFDLQHYINNALKAHGTMRLDEQYVVKDGEVIIVDDFTGRLMYGRRYSDGLHQAIEAKENVKVAHESKTLATITFQNFFRMYEKLSGMTGTALTEEDEFRAIYSLDVICIPTNKDLVRIDEPDSVYKTELGKYKAIVAEVKNANAKKQPILIGTVSVDKSELLSKIFTQNGIKHNVLNAKQHDREAEIIAQAGRIGAVTIATNMAGRGTDILLGGNPEFMAKQELRKQGYDEELVEQSTTHNETEDPLILDIRERFNVVFKTFKDESDTEHKAVTQTGGLLIIGTERHESRRIDNQLRGRAGRQGDPGRSRFYLSLEDDLLRLFGGERMTRLFNAIGVDDEMELKNSMLSKTIESAQKKVEGRNFGIRKNVLEYDDVMNRQREIIYGQRSKVLEGEDLRDTYRVMIPAVVERLIITLTNPEQAPNEWNLTGIIPNLLDVFGPLPVITNLDTTIANYKNQEDLIEAITSEALTYYENRGADLPDPELMREVERIVLLRAVDEKWMDHIDAMDELRNSIGMRGYAQQNPVMEYKREGFEMFEEMNDVIQETAVRIIMRANFNFEQPMERKSRVRETETKKKEVDRFQGEDIPKEEAGHQAPIKREQKRVGRNDPCWCGSGKKYKNCHSNIDE